VKTVSIMEVAVASILWTTVACTAQDRTPS